METHNPLAPRALAPRALAPRALVSRAQGLEWLLFDVDGVLTDGILHYGHDGEILKRFHARDGMGFRLAQRAGLRLGLLSGRSGQPTETRAAELDFEAVILGSRDKAADFATFLRDHNTTAEQVAFAGDDLPDLPVLTRCGLSFAPADAAPEVLAAVDVVLETPGGRGAAREMIEKILKARDQWQDLVERFRET
jgi:3-deoxy-D-manno-octulosonate 8-phosphate phosphatase (KDO 8-P phosphatase)